jgi:hypothetical protein
MCTVVSILGENNLVCCSQVRASGHFEIHSKMAISAGIE